MTSRREFLQATAISGLPVIAGASAIASEIVHAAIRTDLPLRTAFHAVLVDGRHAEALSLGESLASAGATVHTIPDGDITQVWLSNIGPAWRQRPVAVAGLTARPALFCLEQFALACGLRVAFHGEHVVQPGGQTVHTLLRGAEQAHLCVHDLDRSGPLWPARIVEAFAARRQLTGPLRPGPSDAALEPPLPQGAQLLTSWIIAAA